MNRTDPTSTPEFNLMRAVFGDPIGFINSRRSATIIDKILKSMFGVSEEILRKYYFERKTLKEIAEDFKDYGVSAAQIRNRKQTALRKLRHPSLAKQLKKIVFFPGDNGYKWDKDKKEVIRHEMA